MKHAFFTLLIFPALLMVSCNSNNVPDITTGITGTYMGSINVTSPPLQNTSYTVTVSQVSNNRIRITPSTPQATTWEAEIMKPAATTITCVLCGTNQITFNLGSSPVTLSYNYSSSEQFSGTKQ